MTLIALTVNNGYTAEHGYPVLIADILISSPDGDECMPTPTYINGAKRIFSDNKSLKPFGLNQKLYVINDRLCVALGGNLIQMERFLKRLKALYSSIDFDDDDLWRFVDEFSRDEGRGMIAIVLKSKAVAEGEFDFQVRCIGLYNENLVKSRLYGNVIAGGSGAPQFLEFIQSDTKFFTDITDTDAFLAANQSLIAHFLGLEISNAETLSKYWGAGYEMIAFENGRFVKLKEYTVVLLYAPFGKVIEFQAAPFSTMMVSYQEDVMLITTFANNVERIFAVPSITYQGASLEIADFEPKHEALFMSYIFNDVDNGNARYSRAAVFPRNRNEFDQTPIVFERIDGKLRLWKDERQDVAMLKTVLKELGHD